MEELKAYRSKDGKVNRQPTIDELEKLLDGDEAFDLEILPSGEIKRKGKRHRKGAKPLTFKKPLGAEYATASA